MFWAGSMTTTENLIERDLIAKLEDLKYTYRSDIRDRAALEKNFREKFETLNRIRLTDAEFQSLLEQITTPDVFATAKILRERNSLIPCLELHSTGNQTKRFCWFVRSGRNRRNGLIWNALMCTMARNTRCSIARKQTATSLTTWSFLRNSHIC